MRGARAAAHPGGPRVGRTRPWPGLALAVAMAAAAIRCVGGDMQGQLKYRNDDEMRRAEKMGIKDHNRVYGLEDLAQGQVMFAATGVTDGSFLRGVHFRGGGASTHSVVMRSKSGTVRFIEASHQFDRKPDQAWMTWVRPAPDKAK